jgi:hypothetical protein
VRALSPLSFAYESVVPSRASVESCQLASDRQDRRQQQRARRPGGTADPYSCFYLASKQDKRPQLLHALRRCVARLPSQAIGVESCCGQGRTAERVVPAVVFGIELSVEHLGPVSLTVRYIQPLSLPEHSKSPVRPPAALEKCCRCWRFPLFQD